MSSSASLDIVSKTMFFLNQIFQKTNSHKFENIIKGIVNVMK